LYCKLLSRLLCCIFFYLFAVLAFCALLLLSVHSVWCSVPANQAAATAAAEAKAAAAAAAAAAEPKAAEAQELQTPSLNSDELSRELQDVQQELSQLAALRQQQQQLQTQQQQQQQTVAQQLSLQAQPQQQLRSNMLPIINGWSNLVTTANVVFSWSHQLLPIGATSLSVPWGYGSAVTQARATFSRSVASAQYSFSGSLQVGTR
jgi:TolA-binding protein